MRPINFKPQRAKKPMSRRDLHRAQVRSVSTLTAPKLAKARKHRQHVTPPTSCDAFGAFTLTGRNPRRVWVAGVSAQEHHYG